MEELLKEALGSDFEVLRSLGKGRKAEVYLAREGSLDRLVAVKILLKSRAEDDVARARFEREAKAAASINHPSATSVYRFGILSNSVPYLVMQYARGKTLEERVSAEGPLPLEEGRKILQDLAGALAAAHAQGFVHRDVRPGNVLCDEESGRTLLTDFGIAGILPSGKDLGPKLTQTGELLGDLVKGPVPGNFIKPAIYPFQRLRQAIRAVDNIQGIGALGTESSFVYGVGLQASYLYGLSVLDRHFGSTAVITQGTVCKYFLGFSHIPFLQGYFCVIFSLMY